MPSLLIATRKRSDGSLEKIVTPMIDYGPESVQALAEEDRLRALGYETRIERETQRVARPDGAGRMPPQYRGERRFDGGGEGKK